MQFATNKRRTKRSLYILRSGPTATQNGFTALCRQLEECAGKLLALGTASRIAIALLPFRRRRRRCSRRLASIMDLENAATTAREVHNNRIICSSSPAASLNSMLCQLTQISRETDAAYTQLCASHRAPFICVRLNFVYACMFFCGQLFARACCSPKLASL